ncbi:MAG: hypothetical protein WAT81_01665 [Candidatus Moraniibacteriota bacterium]
MGAVLNVLFPDSLRYLNWVAAMAFLLTAVVCLLTPANLLGPAAAAFIAAQPGGEDGWSLKDGTEWGEKWINALGRFAAAIALNGSLPFFVLALWPIGSNPIGAIAILACSVFLAIWSMYTNQDGKFVLNTAAIIMTALIVWTLAGYTPVIGVYQRDLVAWTQHKLGLKSIDDKSTDAKRRAEAATAQARVQAEMAVEAAKQSERNACYAGLEAKAKGNPSKGVAPVIPTTAEFEACAEIGVEKTPVATAPAKNVPPPAAEPNRSTPVVETAWNCDRTWKEVDFAPSQKFGVVNLGTLPAGRYEFAVSGKIWQTLTKLDATGTPVFEQMCEMDADGRIYTCVDQRGNTIRNANGAIIQTGPDQGNAARVFAPGEGYGMFLVHAWGKALPIGAKGQIQSVGDLPIVMNVNNSRLSPLNYTGGHGTFKVKITQCTQT